jgi:hypothetical protein
MGIVLYLGKCEIHYRVKSLITSNFFLYIYIYIYIVMCFTRQRDNNNVDSSDLTREFIVTIVEITHNRYYTHFRV